MDFEKQKNTFIAILSWFIFELMYDQNVIMALINWRIPNNFKKEA